MQFRARLGELFRIRASSCSRMDSEKATWSVNTLSPDRTRLLFQHGQQALVERIGTAHTV